MEVIKWAVFIKPETAAESSCNQLAYIFICIKIILFHKYYRRKNK
jgi:hypothetical protein